jgi:hypothetical protein
MDADQIPQTHIYFRAAEYPSAPIVRGKKKKDRTKKNWTKDKAYPGLRLRPEVKSQVLEKIPKSQKNWKKLKVVDRIFFN